MLTVPLRIIQPVKTLIEVKESYTKLGTITLYRMYPGNAWVLEQKMRVFDN